MNKHLKNVLKYFEKDGDTYHLKKGYICILEGFVDDYITMFATQDDELVGYSMASDNRYLVSDNAVDHFHVYKLELEV